MVFDQDFTDPEKSWGHRGDLAQRKTDGPATDPFTPPRSLAWFIRAEGQDYVFSTANSSETFSSHCNLKRF